MKLFDPFRVLCTGPVAEMLFKLALKKGYTENHREELQNCIYLQFTSHKNVYVFAKQYVYEENKNYRPWLNIDEALTLLTLGSYNQPIIIDLRHCDRSFGLTSRKIWETLFREVKAEKFKSLDSFLCDLNCFKSCFEERHYKFYWNWHESGFTHITYESMGIENECCIELLENEVKITRIR